MAGTDGQPPEQSGRPGVPDDAESTLSSAIAWLRIHWISVALTVLYVVVLIRTAWLADDAYVTFRTVDNFVDGRGLTWNPGERVQAFTNPLWTFILSAAYLLTGEIYYTSIGISIAVSTAVLGWIGAISASRYHYWIGVVALTVSKAYTDYSTSGLENPLTHFLLAGFFYVFLTRAFDGRTLVRLTAIGSLLAVNRLDAGILVAPALVYAFLASLDDTTSASDWLAGTKRTVLGFTPLIAWETFALIYYGFPFPNTYYAKTRTTIGRSELVARGLTYVTDSVRLDPLSGAIVLSGVGIAVLGGHRRLRVLGSGVVLYLLYVLSIGGGFMAGRLLAAPVLLSVLIVISRHRVVPGLEDASTAAARRSGSTAAARQSETAAVRSAAFVVVGAMIVASLATPTSPLIAGPNYRADGVNAHGIADERGIYYPATGLLANNSENNAHPRADLGRSWAADERDVHVAFAIGMTGYYAGPDEYIVDPLALSSPLLARLPGSGRVGHYERRLPAGYIETVTTGENHLKNRGLHAYYRRMQIVVTGPLFSYRRFETIAKMNLGAYEHLLREPYGSYALEYVSEPVPEGTGWAASGTIVFEKPIVVESRRPVHADRMAVTLDSNDVYEATFVRNGTTLGSVVIPIDPAVGTGMGKRTVAIPPSASEHGFTAVRITPLRGDGAYSLGHVRYRRGGPDPALVSVARTRRSSPSSGPGPRRPG